MPVAWPAWSGPVLSPTVALPAFGSSPSIVEPSAFDGSASFLGLVIDL
jgi:hypothetical protein